MQQNFRRSERHILLCTQCGQEIITGDEYWYWNGTCICAACFPDFARAEFIPYRQTRGKEAGR